MVTSLETLKEVHNLLCASYQPVHHFNKDRIFDEILFIFLSWRTPILKAESIYQQIITRFRDLNELFCLSEDEWFYILENGGKARDKSRTIVKLLAMLQKDFGCVENLEMLSQKSENEIYQYLTTLPGIKDKSAYCIMLYTMKKPVFPADAHCLRICQRIGIIQGNNTNKQDRVRGQLYLNMILKGDYERCYNLHVMMIQHGKQICKPRPLCNKCILNQLCEYKKGQ